jgi:DNA-binding LacI/PurR family transcriptional regulator
MAGFISRYAQIPCVTIGFKTSYGNAILTNNAVGFHSLMRHLTDDRGYRKLAFLGGPEKNIDAIERSETTKDERKKNTHVAIGI